eukprot:CAMPEP_0119127560 /NCGR_PEP_ID=MMETSP1310-20130426/6065_1 /TAXON_ID=464262 /ORGANISM="Genus nov. species nov., Strain RCC2339" /LENGTH=583 /DNA_ID=CAMNT_0007117831 /DNA_START=120 /DNA_END=1871 /DNA_ORIENTATION=+
MSSLTSSDKHTSANYYELNVCRPPGGVLDRTETIEELLFGRRAMSSPYNVEVGETTNCAILCTRTVRPDQAQQFRDRIKGKFRVNMLVDGLPAVQPDFLGAMGRRAQLGVDLGYIDTGGDGGGVFLYNHLNIKISFHRAHGTGGFQIVGFEVVPVSIDHSARLDGQGPCVSLTSSPQRLNMVEATTVTWSYSVVWEENRDLHWRDRWNGYARLTGHQVDVHWLSLGTSLAVIVVLTVVTGYIVASSLRADIRRLRREPDGDNSGDLDETGWKLVHGDVFRRPVARVALCVAVASGSNLFAALLVGFLFALADVLLTTGVGTLTVLSTAFILCSPLAGYVAAQLHDVVGARRYMVCLVSTAFAYPFSMGVLLSVLHRTSGEASPAHFFPLGPTQPGFYVSVMVHAALVFAGARLARRYPLPPPPVQTSDFPRPVPPQPAYLRPVPLVLLGGLLPFCTVFYEMYFVLSSMWHHPSFYLFGTLAVFFFFIMSAEVSIVAVYFQLCCENYRWWWRAFLVPASVGLYVFLFAMYWLISQLATLQWSTIMLFLVHAFILSASISLIAGFIGFYASLAFVYVIYGFLKVD